MHDRELVLEVLHQIEDAAAKIVARFEAIREVSDFTDSSAGVEKNGCYLYDVNRYRRIVEKSRQNYRREAASELSEH
jgi:hypothetical protein